MNLSELLSDVTEAEARLRVAAGYLRQAWRRLSEQDPALRTPGGAPPPDDSPDRFISHDQQQRDRRALEDAARASLRMSTVVYDVATRWGQPLHERHTVDAPDDMWCTSCWRDDKYHEPVAAGRYKGLCRFCGDFRAAYKKRPPLKILQARHRGQRVTQPMIQRELRREAS